MLYEIRVVLAVLLCMVTEGQDTRVWQAGGSAERAARGKCWIEGMCVGGVGGPAQSLKVRPTRTRT
jgi:hypothetical protein